MNRTAFYNAIRPLFGSISTSQVAGMESILNEWDKRSLTDLRWLAYMFATTFHETSETMQPVREYGSEAYLRSKPYYPWVGEGLVQVTWEVNHRKFGATAPGQLLTWPACLSPLFDGMIQGVFTGKKLGDYFNDKTADPKNARRIINGTDRAVLIAGYYAKFLAALKAAA